MTDQLTRSENFALIVANNLMNLSKQIQTIDRKCLEDFEDEVKEIYLDNLDDLLEVIGAIYKEGKQ